MVQSRELVAVHIWSQVTLTLFRTTKDLVFNESLHKFSVNGQLYIRKRMKIELANGGLPGAKAGCPMRDLLLCCDISYILLNQ